MASQTAILLLADLATGESGVLGYANWGEAADDNFQKLEDTIGEVTSKTLAGTDVTLTAAEERSLVIKLTGTLSANVAVNTNDRKGFWIVHNGTSGSFTVTFKTTSGSGVVVPQGGKMLLYSDGTDVLPLTGDQIPSDLFRVVDTTDRTKKLDFDISGFTTGQTRTITPPDQDVTITAAAAGVLDDTTVAAMVKTLGVRKYVTKSANYTALLADLGTLFDFSATATLSLTAAATLGANWWCEVKADGGDVTIDPDGSETINGATTLTVSDGESAFVYCTGSAFKAIKVNTLATTSSPGLTELATAAEFRGDTAGNLALTPEFVWDAAEEVTLTDAATIAVDMSTFFNANVTLGGNRTLGNPTNVKQQSGYIRIVQDGTGSRTLAYGSNWEFAGGSAPTLSTAAGAQDLLFYQVLSSTRIYASLAKNIS